MLRIKPLRLAGGYRVACWTHRNGKVFDHSLYIPQLAGSQGSQAEVWLRFASDYLIDDCKTVYWSGFQELLGIPLSRFSLAQCEC